MAKNCHFWPNIGIFVPVDLLPDQKTMRKSCLGGFSIMWVPKPLLTPMKIWIFGPKNCQISSNIPKPILPPQGLRQTNSHDSMLYAFSLSRQGYKATSHKGVCEISFEFRFSYVTGFSGPSN